MPTDATLRSLYARGSDLVLGAGWAHLTRQHAATLQEAAGSFWIVQALKGRAGNLLEIGPGDGSLMRAMNARGWKSYGVDPGKWWDDKSVVTSLQEVPPTITFDALILQDVLEHCSDPWVDLQRYVERLKAGALVFAAVPWAESDEARILGVGWSMVRPIGHLHYFTVDSMSRLFDSVGLIVESVETVSLVPRGLTKGRIRAIVRSGGGVALSFLGRRSESQRARSTRNIREQIVNMRSRGDQLHVVARVSRATIRDS